MRPNTMDRERAFNSRLLYACEFKIAVKKINYVARNFCLNIFCFDTPSGHPRRRGYDRVMKTRLIQISARLAIRPHPRTTTAERATRSKSIHPLIVLCSIGQQPTRTVAPTLANQSDRDSICEDLRKIQSAQGMPPYSPPRNQS